MLTIGLDMAVRTVGIAILEDKNNLLFYASYTSKEKDYLKLQIEITDWLFRNIDEVLNTKNIFNVIPKLILEDVFYGPNPEAIKNTSRTQGGAILKWYERFREFPKIIMATTARKVAGIDPWWAKPEIQLYAIDRFKLGKVEESTRSEVTKTGNHWEIEYYRLMENKKKTTNKQVKEKIDKEIKDLNRITKNTFNRLSTKLKNETQIDEHIADAIVLGLN